MDSKERVIRTLEHKEIDRIPRQCWTLPSVALFRGEELADFSCKFPSDITQPVFRYGNSKYSKGDFSKPGEYTDEWGCVWKVKEPGVIGEVKNPILDDWSKLPSYRMPMELLDEADFSKVDGSCYQTQCFVLAGTQVRPFERMQFLRGTENLFMDLASREDEAYILRDMIHAFNVREISLWAETAVDGVSMMDDWGTQQTLLISPELWRSFYKPLYKEYCDILHNKGKYVFFHSDGNIESIYPDLIEIGIDAVNSQLFCMNIEDLGKKYAGKITFWGEIDRQHLLPFGTIEEVRLAVKRVAKALFYAGRSGVIAQCEWGSKDPKENIEAVFEQWDQL